MRKVDNIGRIGLPKELRERRGIKDEWWQIFNLCPGKGQTCKEDPAAFWADRHHLWGDEGSGYKKADFRKWGA